MSNYLKIQIIKTLALKQKVKCHFMKWGDNILEGGKHQNNSLFSFSTNKFQFFLSLESMLKKFLWRNYKCNLEREL
jgi:hypothetical protein